MDPIFPVPATQAEDLYEALHTQLILERLGQGDLTDALGPAEPPVAVADAPEGDIAPGTAP